MKAILSKTITGCNRLFHKIQSAFSCFQQQPEQTDALLLHFELRYNMLDGLAQLRMKDHIRQMRLAEIQVKESELQEEIPAEYLGRMSCWNGGKLLYQKYLKIQSEYVEKRTIVFLSTSQEAEVSGQYASDNIGYPFLIKIGLYDKNKKISGFSFSEVGNPRQGRDAAAPDAARGTKRIDN